MNYRHAFHAGNFADVHKHVVLLALLDYLQRKPTPLFYLDTHAGRGRYDLRSPDASRGNERRDGIGRLKDHPAGTVAVQRYLQAVNSQDPNSYPGSPVLAVAQLRNGDRAVLVEHQPEEARALERSLPRRKGIAVLRGDGYAALKSHLPPKENRGLVLIDPPYEAEGEFVAVARALQFGLTRWPNGVFVAWYPVKSGEQTRRFHTSLQQSGLRKLLLLELNLRPADSPLGLNGSGVVIANPPWQLDEAMRPALDEVLRLLSPDRTGNVRIEWLVGE